MENINEHDVTRNMLSVMRNTPTSRGYANNLIINESHSLSSDEEELSSTELAEEQQAFRDTVSPRVSFNSFKVYPKIKNVVFSGEFENMDGLEWQFTLEDADGLYITASNVPISEGTLVTLKKLKGYYDNWADEWSQKLATEYNRNSEDDNQEDDVQQSDSV